MPAVSPSYGYGSSRPSCYDRMKTGFIFGFCVGLASGAIFGGFTALRAGYRGRELLNGIGKYMITSAGTFGGFMAVGSGIRC